MYISPSLIMGIALALLLVPWISVKQCHYCDLTDTAKYTSILMARKEDDDCYFDMDEEDNMLPVSGKGCPCLHCYEQKQLVTYLCMTYYTFIVDCWPGELWEFESSDLDQNFNDIPPTQRTTRQILIALLWFLL